MKGGVEYYMSTGPFEQDKIRHYSVRLIFLHDRPEWLRVYETTAAGGTRLLRDLRPTHETHETNEYFDAAQDLPAKSARIYVFQCA
jgi:hypothetical protein